MLNIEFAQVADLIHSQFMRGDFRNLKAALKRVGMSQAELAKRLGVQPSAVSNWCSGYAKPSLGHALAIAEALNMTLSEILGEEIVVAENKQERDHLLTMRELGEVERDQLIRMAQLLLKPKES